MNLEDEKKLVSKWLGWKIFSYSSTDKRPCKDNAYKKPDGTTIWLAKWNPQSDRNCWAEIWGKMWELPPENNFKIQYIRNLRKLLCLVPMKNSLNAFTYFWRFHTSPPEICWRALVESLKGKDGE